MTTPLVLPPTSPNTTTFGFVPYNGPPLNAINPLNGQKVVNPEEEEELKILKSKIGRLLARNPKLVLRTTHKLVEKLEGISKEELENILYNANQDSAEINGTPVAVAILRSFARICNVIGIVRDNGEFEEELIGDEPLKADVEMELAEYIGLLGTKLNIMFRVFNDYWSAQTKKKRKLDDMNQVVSLPTKDNETCEQESTKEKCNNEQTIPSISEITTNPNFILHQPQ